MKGSSKNLIIVVVLIVLVAVAAYFYVGRDQSGDTLLVGVQGENPAVDGDLLSALRELKKLKLDQEIFKNPAWLSLSDFSQTLAPQEKGRINPFAPFSSTGTSTSSQ